MSSQIKCLFLFDYRDEINANIQLMYRLFFYNIKSSGILLSMLQRNIKKYDMMERRQNEAIMKMREKFYLVGTKGLTSFILQNFQNNKFKVTIGTSIKCSCNNTEMHCVHTLFVLLHIFHLRDWHQFLFQHKYTYKELRHMIANRNIYENFASDPEKPFGKLRHHNFDNFDAINEEENEQDQEEDQICAICMMQIGQSDAKAICETVCRKQFHLECFKQWVVYQQGRGNVVKCPLCNDEKEKPLKYIREKEFQHKDQLQKRKVGIQYNYYCDECQLKEIKANQWVYKCVYCEDVTLCHRCFTTNKHIQHSFIYKKGVNEPWKKIADRKNKRKADRQQGLVRIRTKAQYGIDYYLAATLPCYFNKDTRWNILASQRTGIKLQELECVMCPDKKRAFLRRMPCGHLIHHKCLVKRIQARKFHCKKDGQKFLLGYQTQLKHQKLNKKIVVEKKIDIQEQEEQQHMQKQFRIKNKVSSRLKTDLNKSQESVSLSRSKRSLDNRKKEKSKSKQSKSVFNKSNKSFVNPQRPKRH